MIGGAKRLIGVPETDLSLGLAYGLFALLVLTVCIYGFRFMLWVNRIAVWAASLLFLLGVLAFAPTFDSQFAGTVSLGQPGFWAAFIGAALVAMSNPISFGAFLGDWSRYIPRDTPKRRIMLAVIAAQLATLIPFLFGLATATIVAIKAPDYIAANNYVGGLLAVSPSWFFLPVCLIAVIGGMSTGTTSLYGTGLDMSSVFPRVLSRVKATLLIGVLSIAFIFIGRFAANLVQSVSTFAVLIITCTTPWMVIMIIGLLVRRGFYCPDDLQVFTRGETGGRYWFSHGWNWRGLGAWIPSALVGLCFVNLPGQFVGPLGELAGGIDISLPVTLGLASVVYLVLLSLFPEPAAVYGPGIRGARTLRCPSINPPSGKPPDPSRRNPCVARSHALRRNASSDALRHAGTRSIPGGISTQSVGTISALFRPDFTTKRQSETRHHGFGLNRRSSLRHWHDRPRLVRHAPRQNP